MRLLTRGGAASRDVAFGGDQSTTQIQRELGLTFEQAEAAKISRAPGVEIEGADMDSAVDGLSKMLSFEGRFKDVLASDEMDPTAYVIEHLTLALDPFPRKPDAEFEPPPTEAPESPFAALKALKLGKDP